MLNYVIVVNDNGELKTVTHEEICGLESFSAFELDEAVNEILDARSAAAEAAAEAASRKKPA